MKTKFAILFISLSIQFLYSQVSLTGAASTQNFNTLANSGTSTSLPSGWQISEAGGNTTYTAGTGSANTGDSYSFGATSNAERALGGLQSGSLTPTMGASFTNNTGSLIISLAVSYIGEQWRLGATGRSDKLDFQYSLDATSLTTGTWINADALDFTAPISAGTAGALDGNAAANRVSVSSSIGSLSIANGSTFWIRWNSFDATSSDDGLGIDDFSITPTTSACVAASEPTILTSAITVSEGCTSAQINFTNGNGSNRMIVMSTNCTITNPTDHVNYSSNSTFGSGSEVGAVGSGDFVVYDGSLATTIVNGLVSGTTYCFKIYEYNGSSTCIEYLTTGVSSTSFTTSSDCATPQIRSILVNSCETAEGTDEFFVVSNGSSALNLNNVVITFPSLGFDYCNSGCGTNTLVNNATYVNNLNTTAGCSLFQFSTTIPANATLIVFTGLTPPTAYNYSSECPGGGPYYVAFCNNTNTTGRFANNAGANRTLSVNFGSSSDAVTFLSNSANTDTNGDYASFDNDGNVSYGNVATCTAPIPLPMELALFEASGLGNTIEVKWETLSERDLAFFELQMSKGNEDDFQFLAYQKASGNSSSLQTYSQNISNVDEGSYLLRLKNIDFNGEVTFSEPISVDVFGEQNAIKSIVNYAEFKEISFYKSLERNTLINLYDLSGKLMESFSTEEECSKIHLKNASSGLFFLQAISNDTIEQFKFYSK